MRTMQYWEEILIKYSKTTEK